MARELPAMVNGQEKFANTAKSSEDSGQQINGHVMETMQNLNSPCVTKQCLWHCLVTQEMQSGYRGSTSRCSYIDIDIF